METRRRKNRPAPADADGQWRLEPSEVAFHRRRMREAAEKPAARSATPYVVVAVVLAGAAAIYLNVAGVRDLGAGWVSSLGLGADGSATRLPQTPPAGEGELPTEVVGDTGIAGERMPTSPEGREPTAGRENPPPADSAARAAVPADATPPASPAPATPAPAAAPEPREPVQAAAPADGPPAAEPPAATEAAPAEEPPAVAATPPPELPATPESFGFGLNVMQISESDASAAVLVLRDGGRRGVSYITWWTTDGTANAGSDFARLEPRVERFGNGEQNRTIYVPIIGDRNVEGPENFFVHVVAGQTRDAPGEPVARIEVVINDDD